jgi:cytochrome b561
MAAQAERSLNFAHACIWERALTALYGCIAIVAVVTGVLGLLGASGLRQMLESWVNVHLLFGLLLCGVVLTRCRWRVKHSPPMLPIDIRQLSRHLSRIVYLLLYVVIGVRELIAILNSVWHGTGVDFNLFDQRFRGPDYAGFNPKDDFQLFLASGSITLIFLRVLTFTLWLRAVERAALPQVATDDSVSSVLEPSSERGNRRSWLRFARWLPPRARNSTH